MHATLRENVSHVLPACPPACEGVPEPEHVTILCIGHVCTTLRTKRQTKWQGDQSSPGTGAHGTPIHLTRNPHNKATQTRHACMHTHASCMQTSCCRDRSSPGTRARHTLVHWPCVYYTHVNTKSCIPIFWTCRHCLRKQPSRHWNRDANFAVL